MESSTHISTHSISSTIPSGITKNNQDNHEHAPAEKSPQSFQASFATSENTWKSCGVNEKLNRPLA
jgi:hypothetical protein